MKSSNRRIDQLRSIHNESESVFERKNADYGDAFAEYGPIGVIVRMGDKIKRCVSLSKSGINLVDDEKLRDTLIDLHNYAAMTIMLLDESEKTCEQDDQLALSFVKEKR